MWMPAKEDGNHNKNICVYRYDKMKNINNVLSWIMLNATSTYTCHTKIRDSCHSPSHHTPAEKAPLAQYMLGSPLLILALNVVLMTVTKWPPVFLSTCSHVKELKLPIQWEINSQPSSSQNHISWAVELGCHPREHSPASNLYGIFAEKQPRLQQLSICSGPTRKYLKNHTCTFHNKAYLYVHCN